MPFLFLLQRNQAVEAGRSYAFCGNREKSLYTEETEGGPEEAHGVRCAPLPEWDDESIGTICRNKEHWESL